MNQTSIKDVMDQAVAGEPPIGPDLLGDVVRAARKIRRRQVAGVIAATPAVIFGVPALTSALGAPPGHGPGVVTPGHHRHRTTLRLRVTVQMSAGALTPDSVTFVRPKLPSAVPEVSPVPITKQAFGQVLVDELPAGSAHSQVAASVAGRGQNGLAEAGFTSVSTRAGTGFVFAALHEASRPDDHFRCKRSSTVSCARYTLLGGIVVSEYWNQDYGGTKILMFQVSVFRPRIGIFSIEETNTPLNGSTESFNAPLTMSQMVRIGLDPRWRFTISRSFVQQASGLKVGAVPPGF